ncbi:hypothetical protein Tco_0494770 [Tanacetum coccineum]
MLENQNGNCCSVYTHQNGNGKECSSTAEEEAGIQLQAEEFDLMAAAADLNEIEEVNANCILMANLQQASTSGTQTDKALIYQHVSLSVLSSKTTTISYEFNCEVIS